MPETTNDTHAPARPAVTFANQLREEGEYFRDHAGHDGACSPSTAARVSSLLLDAANALAAPAPAPVGVEIVEMNEVEQIAYMHSISRERGDTSCGCGCGCDHLSDTHAERHAALMARLATVQASAPAPDADGAAGVEALVKYLGTYEPVETCPEGCEHCTEAGRTHAAHVATLHHLAAQARAAEACQRAECDGWKHANGLSHDLTYAVEARDAWRDYAEHAAGCVECGETSWENCHEGRTLREAAEQADKLIDPGHGAESSRLRQAREATVTALRARLAEAEGLYVEACSERDNAVIEMSERVGEAERRAAAAARDAELWRRLERQSRADGEVCVGWSAAGSEPGEYGTTLSSWPESFWAGGEAQEGQPFDTLGAALAAYLADCDRCDRAAAPEGGEGGDDA